MARTTLSIPFSRQRLRGIRETKGLSITALAARCTEQGHSVTLGAIGKVEGGINGPSPALVAALAKALGVEVQDLLDEDAAA